MRSLLLRLGDPHLGRGTIHIAGSKGKGSTAAMIAAVLRAAGHSLGLYSQPHLHRFVERIVVGDEPIAPDDFGRLMGELAPQIEAEDADGSYGTVSTFEALTALAFLYFRERSVQWQVLEVGLGGRLDTTNAVAAKEVAVITPIDLEHTAILGDTIPEIAAEKAGIIGGACEVVVAPMRDSALDVVRARAAEVGATLHVLADECAQHVTSQTLEGQRLDLRTPVRTYRGLRLPLVGPHQAQNAGAAVRAAELAFAASGEELPERAVHEGLAKVRAPGRFEVLRRNPLVIVDGMHTALAAKRFRQTVDALSLPRQRALVVGLLEGKDLAGVVRELVAADDSVIVTRPASSRAADPGEVAEAFAEAGVAVQRAPDLASAIERASVVAGERGVVFVVGSLYLAAEARELLLAVTGDRAFGLR